MESSVTQDIDIEIEDREFSVIVEPRRILSECERPQFTQDEFSIHAAAVVANNFEIKASAIGMIQNLV